MDRATIAFLVLLVGYFVYKNYEAKNSLSFDMPKNKNNMLKFKNDLSADYDKKHKEIMDTRSRVDWLDIDSLIYLEVNRRLFDIWDRQVIATMVNSQIKPESRNRLYGTWHSLMYHESSWPNSLDMYVNAGMDADPLINELQSARREFEAVMSTFGYDCQKDRKDTTAEVEKELREKYKHYIEKEKKNNKRSTHHKDGK